MFKVSQHTVNAKEIKTGDTCAADFKQISIWLANKGGNK